MDREVRRRGGLESEFAALVEQDEPARTTHASVCLWSTPNPVDLPIVSLLCEWVIGRSDGPESYQVSGGSGFIFSVGSRTCSCKAKWRLAYGGNRDLSAAYHLGLRLGSIRFRVRAKPASWRDGRLKTDRRPRPLANTTSYVTPTARAPPWRVARDSSGRFVDPSTSPSRRADWVRQTE